jgi:murein DD-endopeptidase MepM/ murein hydrolase activator NlpD
MQIDPQFQQSRNRARKRRNRRIAKRLVVFGFIPVSLILSFIIIFTDLDQRLLSSGDVDFTLVQMESDIVVAPVTTASGFIDISGDPIILRFEADAAKVHMKSFSGPETLDTSRFGPLKFDRLIMIQDDLFVQERRLVTALPSTREDFALFQAQRSRSLAPLTPVDILAQAGTIDAKTEVELGNLTESYGKILETDANDTDAQVERNEIKNNTSITYIKPEAMRRHLYEDIIIITETARNFTEILQSNGFSKSASKELSQSIAGLLPVDSNLAVGSIIALRIRPSENNPKLLQMSLYAPTSYIGSIAKISETKFVSSADPWLEDALLTLSTVAGREDTSDTREYRLLDSLYSALIRNGVPTTLVGEIVVMMSQAHDLDNLARAGDKLTLVYSKTHGANSQSSGQVVFVSINGGSDDRQCYVVKDTTNGGFNCYVPNAHHTPHSGGGTIRSPVSGIMTSKFGPRKHPILKTVRLHAGVDWAAPTGTPVYAAAAGKVQFSGDGNGYGNLLIIGHANGLETRYAHLNKFAADGKAGNNVQAGDLIGFVGTTGRSTGPHLHFELRKDGKPVDPIPYLTGGKAVIGSSAVEKLVSQIIRVESAGNASAKNPLSTATGLGQFIESTWLRMMRNYRPDLAGSMKRADLLALRTDPTLSRNMVKRLAQENEAYLRSRGHNPTSGQLYLAHFLGPGGAAKVLGANNNTTILNLMGAAVVKANPFLRNYTVAKLKGWADRKMRSKGRAITQPPPVIPVSTEIKLFKAMVDKILRQNN